MSDTVSFPLDSCRGATPGAANRSWSSTGEIDVQDDKTRAARCEGDQAGGETDSAGSRYRQPGLVTGRIASCSSFNGVVHGQSMALMRMAYS
jgi:hypothetical protein